VTDFSQSPVLLATVSVVCETFTSSDCGKGLFFL